MSHFAELSQLYDAWSKAWFEDYIQHRRLPSKIAHAFEEFLGGPKNYSGRDNGGETTKISYVAAARAIREPDDKFTLSIDDSSEIAFDDDGSLHFGLRVMMESAPNAFPKHPFWFLLHARLHGDTFKVEVKRSGKEFEVGIAEALETHELCEHLLEQLKLEMAESPFRRRSPEPIRMGFGPPPGSK